MPPFAIVIATLVVTAPVFNWLQLSIPSSVSKYNLDAAVYRALFPVLSLANTGYTSVSVASSANTTLDAVVAVTEFPVQEPELPLTLPTTSPV